MRRVLLVGMNDYPSAPLTGCVNDAKAMERMLRRHDDGTVNLETELLASEEETVTRALREDTEALFTNPADVALLFLSGHGTASSLGGYLVTTDAALYEEGVALADVLALANRATQISEIVIFVDSCHSGWLARCRPPTARRPRSAGGCRSSPRVARRDHRLSSASAACSPSSSAAHSTAARPTSWAT
jgi:uncharacterized caspase-like protein